MGMLDWLVVRFPLFGRLIGIDLAEIDQKARHALQVMMSLPQEDVAWEFPRSTSLAMELEHLADQIQVAPPLEVGFYLMTKAPRTVMARKEVWPEPIPYDLGPGWTFERGFGLLDPAMDAPESWQILATAKRIHEATGKKVFPILRLVGTQTVFGVNGSGKWVKWLAGQPEALHPIEQRTFQQVLELQVDELRNRISEMKTMMASGATPWAHPLSSP